MLAVAGRVRELVRDEPHAAFSDEGGLDQLDARATLRAAVGLAEQRSRQVGHALDEDLGGYAARILRLGPGRAAAARPQQGQRQHEPTNHRRYAHAAHLAAPTTQAHAAYTGR